MYIPSAQLPRILCLLRILRYNPAGFRSITKGLPVPISRSDNFNRRFRFCCLVVAPVALSFSIAKPAFSQEQIAQAIPSAPPMTGIYAQNNALLQTTPASDNSLGGSALGEAIDKASSASTEDNTGEGSAAISLPRIDAPQQDDESRKIAQAASATTDTQPLDLAPVKLPERTSPVFQTNTFKTGILYRLPARMFFQSSTENSLRLETNVLQTLHRNRADMIYRILPNVTVGYALTKTTRIAANYFFLRDQYTRNNHFLSRNIHSIGLQLNQDIPINEKTNLTLGFMGRQLLLSRGQPLFDLLPSVQLTRRVGNNALLYGGLLGQIRFRNTLGKFQEGDPFYTLGGMYRTPRWQFLWDNTLVTNYGNRRLRFGPDNAQMIMTLEAGYRVSPRLPVVAFVRAQPIFNIGANQATGFAGFNFRIFGGLRIDLNKAPIFPVDLKRK